MSAFAFDFDLEDDLDESFDAIPLQKSAAAPPSADDTSAPEGAPISSEIPAEEIQLSALLSVLPEAISYSPLTLPGPSGRTLVRRDLFDVRFQLLAQGERDERTAAFVDAPADLISGAYEGGLKTWECALDLAAYLDRDVLGTTTTMTTTTHAGAARRQIRGSRVLELGCGTAVPTLLLLDRLFAQLAAESGDAVVDPPSGGDGDAGSMPVHPSPRETDVHLQDYNRSVLELVTFPNILLAWYMSPLSAEYRSSASDSDSDNDIDQQEEGEETARGHAARAPPRRGPGGLTVTRALLNAFTASLNAHKVRLRFFAGGWASLRELLARPERPPPSYDIVLASETIYRTESLGAFLGLLRAATSAPVAGVAVVAPCDREVVRPPLCLVAAKVLYFGVGGGVQGFVRAVEEEHGTVRTVWEHREGVGRVIMHIE